jgi:hypothetical protein
VLQLILRREIMAAFCPICFEGDDATSDFEALSSDQADYQPLGSGGDNAQPPPVSGVSPNDPSSSTAATVASCAEPPHPPRFLIRGRYCSHGFCRPCLEAILLVSTPDEGQQTAAHQALPSRRRLQQQEELIQGDDLAAASSTSSSHTRHPGDVAIVGVPTQGSCPICRARLSLFDLRWLDADQSGGDDNNDASNYVYKDEIVTDWTHTPLAGKVYANLQGVGFYSFHFPGADPGTASSSSSPPTGPYVNIEEASRMTGNPNRAPDALPLREFQWHGPSRTMRATVVDLSSRLSDKVELLQSFASGFRCVPGGAKISYWREFSSVEELHAAFPLDGTLRAAIVDASGGPPANEPDLVGTKTVRVGANRFVMDHRQHMVRAVPGSGLVYFLCPEQMEMSRRGTWDFNAHPEGPQNGESIVCPVAPGLFEKWTMLRKATVPPPADVKYCGPTAESLGQYRLYDADPLPITPPRYHGATLHGNAFCQGGKVGLASYHFSAPEHSEGDSSTGTSATQGISAYISYESPDVARWPPLDDGSPPPSRVNFRDASFDPTTRTFTGSIRWLDEHGTTWQRMKRWDYVMRFDSDFTCIVGGNVTSYGVDDDNSDEGREFSRFGENLVYVNAALGEYFRSSLGTEEDAASDDVAAPLSNSPVPPSSSESFVRRSEAFRERLRQEGASVRTIAAVHREWVKACQASSSDPAGSAPGRAS